jgi:MFS family permease
LDWSPEETQKFNTLINFSSQVGKACGALYGGKIIPDGRKNVFIKYNVLALFSCLVMQYVSIWTLAFGKLLNGFFVTVVHIAAVKMINETVPVEVLGKYGSVYMVGQASGYLLVMGFGLGLPSGDYKPGLDSDLNIIAK